MSIKVWELIVNAVGPIGAALVFVFGFIKVYKEHLAADVEKQESKNRASVDIERERSKGLKDLNELRRDVEFVENNLKDLREDMFNDKKELFERIDKIKHNIEETTRDYFRILSKQ